MFFEKIKRAWINKIRTGKKVTTDTIEIQRIVRDYYKQLYGRNGQILRKWQSLKTEPERNRT